MLRRHANTAFLWIAGLLWLAVPAIDMLGRLCLDKGDFAFRAWEIMATAEPDAPGPFKVSSTFDKLIYGDLANLLNVRKFRRIRHQHFQTDAYGFRNPAAPDTTYYPIVTIGDSDMAGSSLSDHETFSARLAERLGVRIYNYAPRSLAAFLADPRFKARPPRLIIWEHVERTIFSTVFRPYADWPDDSSLPSDMPLLPPSPPSEPRLSTYWSRAVFHELRWRLTGLRPPDIGHIDPASGMLFYAPGIQMVSLTARQRGLSTVLKGIRNAHRYCRQQGITLLYLPLPDKENIYRFRLPAQRVNPQDQQPFLQILHAELVAQGIPAIDLYTPFRDLAAQGELLYFPDDTHWNAQGVAAAADIAARYIREQSLLPESGITLQPTP